MPFVDHVFSFAETNNKIFFRNFEIAGNNNDISLVEIGPRFVVTPIKILNGVTSGDTLYKNGQYLPVKTENLKRSFSDKNRKKDKKRQSFYNPEEITNKDVFG
jgi:RNA-binding protein required for 60S ribosomal subunit biogenesis